MSQFRFGIGDRIVPSDEGLRTFHRWAEHKGTILGTARDPDIWQVRWDGSAKVKLIHADFIATEITSTAAPPRRRAG